MGAAADPSRGRADSGGSILLALCMCASRDQHQHAFREGGAAGLLLPSLSTCRRSCQGHAVPSGIRNSLYIQQPYSTLLFLLPLSVWFYLDLCPAERSVDLLWYQRQKQAGIIAGVLRRVCEQENKQYTDSWCRLPLKERHGAESRASIGSSFLQLCMSVWAPECFSIHICIFMSPFYFLEDVILSCVLPMVSEGKCDRIGRTWDQITFIVFYVKVYGIS